MVNLDDAVTVEVVQAPPINLSIATGGTQGPVGPMGPIDLPPRLAESAETNYLPGNDWNNATQTGLYRDGGAGANAPSTGNVYYGFVEAGAGADYVTQTLHNFFDMYGTWRRTKSAGTWYPWQRVRVTETELDARYTNVNEVIANTQLPTRLQAKFGENGALMDANGGTDTGWYLLNGGGTNLPEPTNWFGMEVQAVDNAYIEQTAWALGSSNTYRRRWANGTNVWTAWTRLYQTEAELDARYMNVGEALINTQFPLRLRERAALVADANEATAHGTYILYATSANRPPGGNEYLTLMVMPWDGGAYTTQIASEVNNQTLWYRQQTAGNWGAWKQIMTSDDSGWQTPTLLNGWGPYGGPFTSPRYRKLNGIVYLEGLAVGGSVGQDIFDLPVGYRPNGALIFPVLAADMIARVDVSSIGSLAYVNGPAGWVSLSGISFPADQ